MYQAYSYASTQYLLGDALMAAPVGSTRTNYTHPPPHALCTPGRLLGCYDDHVPKLEPHAGTTNDPNLTTAKCAARCALGDTHMAIDSAGHTGTAASQCYCGTAPIPANRKLPDAHCNTGCSGNRSEPCGGEWAASVYEVSCPPQPPTRQQPSPPADLWIPPGRWYPWSTANANASHAIAGPAILRAQTYLLGEIPLFAREGAVVPTQTMQKEGGPLVWVVFPGSGRGTCYEDDGTTTKYQGARAAAMTTTLTHATDTSARTHTLAVSGQPPTPTGVPRRHVLQLRRLAGDRAMPKAVECNGKVLPNITPPAPAPSAHAHAPAVAMPATAAGATSTHLPLTTPLATPPAPAPGWWVVPPGEDSLWMAAGSIMVSLPIGPADITVVVTY